MPFRVGDVAGKGARFKLELLSGKSGIDGKVLFYGQKGKLGCFSNFAPHPFRVGDLSSPTAEHFFQAMKFWTSDRAYGQKVLAAADPKDAATMGRNRDKPMRKDWENVKDDAMRIAVANKFAQNEDQRAVLLGTGDNEIVENAPHDLYWGNAWELGGIGKNMLGQILEEVRAVLRSPDPDGALQAYLQNKLKRVLGD